MARLKYSSAILLETKLPLAVAEAWTLGRLAVECHCGRDAARSALRRYQGIIQRQSQIEMQNQAVDLGHVARKARDAALVLLERHTALVERAVCQLEDAEDLDIRDLEKLTKARLDLHRLVEQLTGLNVAKAVAIRRFSKMEQQPVIWDGVESLEALPVLELLDENDVR